MSENCQKIEGVYGLVTRNPLTFWSGRPDSNRRRPAWEAGILPLNYGRTCAHSSPDTLEVNDLRGPRMAPHSPIFAPRLALRRAASAVFRRSAPLEMRRSHGGGVMSSTS